MTPEMLAILSAAVDSAMTELTPEWWPSSPPPWTQAWTA